MNALLFFFFTHIIRYVNAVGGVVREDDYPYMSFWEKVKTCEKGNDDISRNKRLRDGGTSCKCAALVGPSHATGNSRLHTLVLHALVSPHSVPLLRPDVTPTLPLRFVQSSTTTAPAM